MSTYPLYQKMKGSSQKLVKEFLSNSQQRLKFTHFFILIVVIFNIVAVSLIIASLFVQTSVSEVTSIIYDFAVLEAIKITVSSVLISAVITVIIGVPVSYVIARGSGGLYTLIDIIISIPLVLPPAVSGLALLMAFGKRGLFNQLFATLSLNISFTFIGLIFVQVFTMLPLFVQSLKGGFQAVDQGIEETAIMFGAEDKELLFSIYLPLSRKSFITGMIIGCLRAAGEFGATIMFAGNLTGKTQTLATTIYTFAQQDIEKAISLSVILILIFLLPLLVLKILLKKS